MDLEAHAATSVQPARVVTEMQSLSDYVTKNEACVAAVVSSPRHTKEKQMLLSKGHVP